MGYAETLKELNIMVDPKMELLSVIEFLSGCFSQYLLTRFNFRYKQEIIKYFSRYKKHQSIKFYTDLCNKDFNFDAPVQTVLRLSSLPEMKVEKTFDNYLVKRAGGREKLYKFAGELSKFAKETKFLEFFDSHTQFYSSIVNDLKIKMNNFNLIGALEEYYGKGQASYNVILVNLFSGDYGPWLKKENDKYDIFAIVGPTGIGHPEMPLYEPDAIKFICLHEFSHSFVNPITKKFIEYINKYSMLLQPFLNKMKHQGYNWYSNWETCVNEHIVRAIVGRMYFGKNSKMREGYLSKEENQGFIYIRAIDEKQRDRYPKFEDFYPEIVKLWGNLYKIRSGEKNGKTT